MLTRAVLLVTCLGTAVANAQLCHDYSGLPAGEGVTAGMVYIPGGTFTMGSNHRRREERMAHPVTVGPFWIDAHEVTNAQFAAFVAATGYVTVAEQGLDATSHPHLPPALRVPGSMVFSPPEDDLQYFNVNQWWRYQPGASWRTPLGPSSDITGKDHHPVVHVAHEDAQAYARWKGRTLPTEAQWEFAARGGLAAATYPWGNTPPGEGGQWPANTWQGAFPMVDRRLDGHHGTSPVGCYPPNGYGLYDVAGNVWEYARDWYVPGHPNTPQRDPTGPPLALAKHFAGPAGPSAVIKGGSWLCAPNYCRRYRPSARQPQELSLGSNHIGFRTVLVEPAE